ncbi:MAG: SAF domain-containing protein [Nocardioidaceae bacterium]|nr:SAF domain-containing protein [Nocardioidaceae bacterium]
MKAPALRSFRADLRRAIAARRRPLAAICAAAAVASGISAARPPPPPVTTVVVAARDLPAGAVLGTSDLTTSAWPRGTAPAAAISADELPLGRTVAGPMRAGEPLTDVRLVQPGLLEGYPADSVLAMIRVADPAASSVVAVGDVVDVIGADPQGRAPAIVVARGAPVVSLPEKPADALSVSDGLVLILAVPEGSALRLADAAVRLQLSVLLT